MVHYRTVHNVYTIFQEIYLLFEPCHFGTMSEMKRATEPMKDLLEKKIVVPDYQRDYSWTNEEVADFLSDLHSFINSNDEEYLYGQIKTHFGNNTRYIIDGQQRLCTSVIYLKVIWDIAEKLKEENSKAENLWEMTYALRECVGEKQENGDLRANLTMGGSNKVFFKDYIIDGDHSIKASNKSNKRIAAAYAYIFKYISELLEGLSFDDKVKLLENIGARL